MDQLRQKVSLLEEENQAQHRAAQDFKATGFQRERDLQTTLEQSQMETEKLTSKITQFEQDAEKAKTQLATFQTQLSKVLETIDTLHHAHAQSKDSEIKLTNQISHLDQTITGLQRRIKGQDEIRPR